MHGRPLDIVYAALKTDVTKMLLYSCTLLLLTLGGITAYLL